MQQTDPRFVRLCGEQSDIFISKCMIDKDAFSNGQIDSKLWLCRELEKLEWTSDLTHVYGGWHGILSFLLLSRDFKVKRIRSFDEDPNCEAIADMINENWVIKEWQFKAHTANCNQMPIGELPDLIINTSTEHFNTMQWFDSIPSGMRVIVQGNNLIHDNHTGNAKKLNDFENLYKLTKVVYRGQLDFNYHSSGFTRFMIMGYK